MQEFLQIEWARAFLPISLSVYNFYFWAKRKLFSFRNPDSFCLNYRKNQNQQYNNNTRRSIQGYHQVQTSEQEARNRVAVFLRNTFMRSTRKLASGHSVSYHLRWVLFFNGPTVMSLASTNGLGKKIIEKKKSPSYIPQRRNISPTHLKQKKRIMKSTSL